MYTCLNLAAQVRSLYPFLGKWVFAFFGDSEFVLCEPSFGIMLVFKPLQGPSVPIKAKDAVPGDATPTRNEVTPPPGQLGLGFQKTKVPHHCSLQQGLRASRRKISHAHFSIRGPAQRPRVLILPGLELERKRQKKCLNTVL